MWLGHAACTMASDASTSSPSSSEAFPFEKSSRSYVWKYFQRDKCSAQCLLCNKAGKILWDSIWMGKCSVWCTLSAEHSEICSGKENHTAPHSHTPHPHPSLTHTNSSSPTPSPHSHIPHPLPPLTHTHLTHTLPLLIHTHTPLTSCYVPIEHIKDLRQRLEEEEAASKNVNHLPPVVWLPADCLLNLCQNSWSLCVMYWETCCHFMSCVIMSRCFMSYSSSCILQSLQVNKQYNIYHCIHYT